MGNVTAQKLAVEFVRILGEGWNPDPDEFLNRVPQEHREECRRHIEELAELNGLGLTPQTPEPQPGREGGAEEPDSALPEEQAHDDHGLEWIEKQVVSSGAGAGAVAFSIVPEDPQPAVAAEEDVATEAPTERSPRAAPVVRVKRAIDELWGHVGAERGVAEADLPAPKGLLSVADELCNHLDELNLARLARAMSTLASGHDSSSSAC